VYGIPVLLGNGNGTFYFGAGGATGTATYQAAVGYFNADANADVIVTVPASNWAFLTTGNGAGGLGGFANTVVGAYPTFVTTGDFNNDDRQDFAVTSRNADNITVRFGNGGGGFYSSLTLTLPVGDAPLGIATGDFNRDGVQDLAVANSGTSNNASILLGGCFAAVTYAAGGGTGTVPTQANVPVGDSFIVADNTLTRTGYGFAGWSDGTNIYQPGDTYTTGNSNVTLTAQWTPLIALGAYPNTDVVLGGNTTVTPDAAPAYTDSINVSTDTNFKGTLVADPATGVVRVVNAHPAGTYTVTVKAFGVDGTTATSTFTLTVTNDATCTGGTAGFSGSTNVSVGSYPRSVAVGDFNNDGKQDFAAANYSSNTVSIRLGNGAGGFSGATNVSVGSSPRSVVVGDFNNDGKQDFATANYGSNTVSIRLGNGAGGFSGTTNVSVGSSPYSVAVGDFNNDGKQDFATANLTADNTVSIRLGNGAGGFSGSTDVSVSYYPSSVAVGDFNNDGKQDFAAANSVSNNVSIRLGNGAGGFSGTTNVSVGSYPYSVAVGDFNNDGKQDFATANSVSNNVSIRLGNGAGGFSGATNVSVGSSPYSVAVGDFNNDGKQDFATANVTANTVSIRLGNGAGGFSGSTNVSVGSYPYSVAVGDFNNDGKQDFATANYYSSNTVSIRLGNLPLCYDGNSNTGGTAPASATYAPGAMVTVSGNTGSLVKTGYAFIGWNTAADGSGTSYAPAATFSITASTILYAKWGLPPTANAGVDQSASTNAVVTL
ncbi:MAG: hypothetical protein EHM48_06050, partial [Planctomycetaceae bacterium]